MPFQSQKEKLILSVEEKEELETIVRSRTERMHRIERVKILLGYAGGASVSEIARKLGTNRPKVERCLNKALQLGGGSGPEGFAGTREETDHHPRVQGLARVFGLPESEGTGLCPGTVDHAFAGQTRPPALPAGGASHS